MGNIPLCEDAALGLHKAPVLLLSKERKRTDGGDLTSSDMAWGAPGSTTPPWGSGTVLAVIKTGSCHGSSAFPGGAAAIQVSAVRLRHPVWHMAAVCQAAPRLEKGLLWMCEKKCC